MPLARKLLIGIATLLVLLILLNYGASYYISKKLPSILAGQKDFPYDISYDDLDVNLLSGSFTVHNAYLAPKDSSATALKQGVFAKVETIDVEHLELINLWRNNKIKVKTIILNTPEVILYDRPKKYTVEDDFSKPFRSTINTGSVEIIDGNFRMLDSKQRIAVKAANIDFKILNIKVDSTIAEQNIPVKYSDYKFTCDSVFYRMDQFYNVTADNIIHSDTSMVINGVKLIPKYSRASFTKAIPVEKDLFNVSVKRISLPAVEWGYQKNILFVHAPKITLDNVYANIYRNKLPKDDPKTKPMYSELLRNLDFDLKADKVLLRNSQIVYEEQNDWSKPAGKVTFSKFYATITNIYSPRNKKKFPTTMVDAQCMFMKATPLKATWTFNLTDKNDSFVFKGNMQSIRTEEINVVSRPLMNVNTKGTLKHINFTINGNKHKATGTFGVNYDDLKIEVLEEDGKEKRGLLSKLGNLLVKDDTDKKVKQTQIQVTRAKDKSFFNFIWLCVQDGLRQAVLPKFIEKRLPDVRPAQPKKKKRRKEKD